MLPALGLEHLSECLGSFGSIHDNTGDATDQTFLCTTENQHALGHTHEESITDQQASERSPDVFVSHCKRLAASEDRAVWVADVSRVINLSPERSP